MQISPLQLNTFWIGKVVIEPAAQPLIHPDVQITVETTPVYRRNDADPRNWIVDLRVAFRSADDRKVAYEGSVEMTGIFKIISDFSEKKQMEMIAVNSPSILYSSIREFVSMVTAHGPHGKLVLPSVSFIDQKLLPLNKESHSVQPESKAEPASR
jgi:preprotein translocase subunit SecB